jgi:hypothetical protein
VSAANVQDPQVIRELREQLATFLRAAAAALGGRANELARMRDWLRGEQQSQWKRELVKREEAFQVARRQWLEAEAEVTNPMNSRGPRRASSMEERVVMDRARRRRDEAEEKLATVRRCLIRLDQECEPLVQQCQSIDLALRDLGDKALHRLERMADRVQDYLDAATAPALAPMAPAGPAVDAGAVPAAVSAEPPAAVSAETPAGAPAAGA